MSDRQAVLDEATWRFENVYREVAISSSPRVEITAAFLLFSISLGALVALVFHATSSNNDIVYPFIVFLFVFAWNLAKAAVAFIAIVDEVAFRLVWTIGLPVRVARSFWPLYFPLVAMIGVVSYATYWVICFYFPYLRWVPYSGGG